MYRTSASETRPSSPSRPPPHRPKSDRPHPPRAGRPRLKSRPTSTTLRQRLRRGGRVVECAGFENRSARKGSGSSNLPLSARKVTTHVNYVGRDFCVSRVRLPHTDFPETHPNSPPAPAL